MYTLPERIMGLAWILNVVLPMFLSVDPGCDHYQEMVIGQEYYIFNKEYPGFYQAATTCRWTGRSPPGSVIVLTCDPIQIPSSNNCQSDAVSISLTGDANLQDGIRYCGETAATLLSQDNSLTVGLFSSPQSSGGRFLCTLTAMQVGPAPTTTARPNTCDCGWKQTTRIVGGQNAGINEFPSMAVIIDRHNFEAYCGASIISEWYALTASHCLLRKEPGDIGLLVGDWDLTTGNDTEASALYKIADFLQHPQYDVTTQQNDLAILMTEKPIVFSVKVGPICLPFRYTTTDFYAQTVTALGWGFKSFSGDKSDILQKVDLSVVANSYCVQEIPDPVIDQQICTYAPKKDTCLSDSGGPLIWQDARSMKLQLVGIISYGIGCATTAPAVNTRVTSYLPWIVSVTKGAVYCIK